MASVPRFILTLTLVLSLQAVEITAHSRVANASESVASAPQIQITPSELENALGDRLMRVREFEFIREEAAKLGLRAWLFGGTAAGFGHYVKSDLRRTRGDTRFNALRFDYDYTNIYRSTQDLDIVIDGTPAQAEALEQALREKYPHLQGGKSAWEVRLLRQDRGDKQALLNNPDFLNQHSDSNSTGLIEITAPKAGEPVVRDTHDWNSIEPYFLKDLSEGKIHYYFSPLHETTKYSREGRNPPILSVIRYLTKTFQYGHTPREEDMKKVQEIIDGFEPHQIQAHSYVAKWIEKNAKKLIQNAESVEQAWNVLEKTGLRSKLIAIRNDVSQEGTLAWWLNREPLPTLPVGQGEGKRFRDLYPGDPPPQVAHETRDFLAFESITQSPTGEPNVLISRDNVHGETAMHGNGFYTRVGREGARGTGLTIRFTVDPNAREGTDFIVKGDYLIFRNKAALRVIPESLNLGPVEYFQYLSKTQNIDPSDRGVLERLRRRVETKLRGITPKERAEIDEIVSGELQAMSAPGYSGRALVATEWFERHRKTLHLARSEALMPEMRRAVVLDLIRAPRYDQDLLPFTQKLLENPDMLLDLISPILREEPNRAFELAMARWKRNRDIKNWYLIEKFLKFNPPHAHRVLEMLKGPDANSALAFASTFGDLVFAGPLTPESRELVKRIVATEDKHLIEELVGRSLKKMPPEKAAALARAAIEEGNSVLTQKLNFNFQWYWKGPETEPLKRALQFSSNAERKAFLDKTYGPWDPCKSRFAGLSDAK